MNEKEIAKKICNYNGQSGTDKQIEKVLKSLPTIELLKNFCKGRINI